MFERASLRPYLASSLLLHGGVLLLLLLWIPLSSPPKQERGRLVAVSSIKLQGDPKESLVPKAIEAAPPLLEEAPLAEKREESALPLPQRELPEATKALGAVEAAPPQEKKAEAAAPPKKSEALEKREPPKEAVKERAPKALPKKESPKRVESAKKESPKATKSVGGGKKEAAKASPPTTAAPKKEALLREARESLAKMGGRDATSLGKASLALAPLNSLRAEEPLFSLKGAESDSYAGGLVQKLKLSLRLPETGEVIVDLTLQRDGRVAKVKIRESKSLINKRYVESTLPTLQFLPFGSSYPKEPERLFTLSLQNAPY